MAFYLYDPIQLKEFGYEFFEESDSENSDCKDSGYNDGDRIDSDCNDSDRNGSDGGDDKKVDTERIAGFSYRYQKSKALAGLINRVYIPLGPIAPTKESFVRFTNHLDSLKRTKVIIDLPVIYDSAIRSEVRETLVKKGFKERKYIQDDETLVLNRENYKVRSHHMNKVRYGERFFDIEVKKELSEVELKRVYEIYLISSKRINFIPKSIEVFKVLMKNSLSSVAISKETKQIEGFVFCCYQDFFTGGLTSLTQKDISNILLVMFTASSDYGREKKVGYVMHKVLFDRAFDDEKTDLIDFHGASRSQGKIYVDFKESFGGEFISSGGSFERVRL